MSKFVRPISWVCYLLGFSLIILAEYLAHDYTTMYMIYQNLGISQDMIFGCGIILFVVGLVCTMTIEDNSALESIREWLRSKK